MNLTLVISDLNLDKKKSQNLNESDKILINQMINKLSIKEIINLINREKNTKKRYL